MLNWIVNVMGILIYFIIRYENRTNKTKFKFGYWIRDNFPELLGTLLINITLMVFLTHPETKVDIHQFIDKYVPFGLVLETKMASSFLSGLAFSGAIYWIVKKFKRK